MTAIENIYKLILFIDGGAFVFYLKSPENNDKTTII